MKERKKIVATKYVDLARAGTGYAGTALDPYSQADWFAVGSVTYDYFVKGTGPDLANGSALNLGPSSTVVPWIASPWRIHCLGTLNIRKPNVAAGDCTLNGGIIAADTEIITLNEINLSFCFIKTPILYLDQTKANVSLAYLGNHFVLTKLELHHLTLLALDCILDTTIISQDSAGGPFGGDSAITIDYCAYTLSNAAILAPPPGNDPVHTITMNVAHNEESWVPPTWPAWNANAALFAYPLLAPLVLTPPQPGNPPYNTYAVDPWGNARTGIGFGWFRATTPARSLFGVDGIYLGAQNPPEDGTWRIEKKSTYEDHQVYDAASGIWSSQNRLPVSNSMTIIPDSVPPVTVNTVVTEGREIYDVTFADDTKFNNPTGQFKDGQNLIYRIYQGVGGKLATYDTKFRFSTGLPAPTLSVAAGKTDILGFKYNTTTDTWDFLAVVIGF
jgi:hypothetical protein